MHFRIRLEVVESGQAQNVSDPIYTCIYHRPPVINKSEAREMWTPTVTLPAGVIVGQSFFKKKTSDVKSF